MAKPWQDLTDMFDSEDCIEEMSKKYKGTYLRIVAGGKKFLAKYHGWNGNHHVFLDEHGTTLTIADETDVSVTIWMPRRGLYNTKENGAYIFVRLPWRQYRRGISKESAQVHSMNYTLLSAVNGNALEKVVFELADARLQADTSLDDAILKAGQYGSWAMNRQWGVTLNVQGEDANVFHLFYEDILVADVVGHEIHIKEQAFQQEVLDDYADWAPNYKVIV